VTAPLALLGYAIAAAWATPALLARLAELAADDRAACLAGRRVLMTALLAIATGTAIPGAAIPAAPLVAGNALAAAAHAVPARVERLLHPPGPRAAVRSGLPLALLSALLIAAPAVLAIAA
jgi:hypothetical protein